MEMQHRFSKKYEGHGLTMRETFEETDIKGNNNMCNSLKTETNCIHNFQPSSLIKDSYTKEKKLKVDNTFFMYTPFKKAIDLRIHNRTLDGMKRTIFDDAEYFAKNFCYKLLPITFEQVDETVIQSEHNYSLSSLNSESEPEEDCSRTMDYLHIKEKNYKRRRTKAQEDEIVESLTSGADRKSEFEVSQMFFHRNEACATEHDLRKASVSLETGNSVTVQPLDLSVPSLVQGEKTDHYRRERPNSILENDEVTQPDSDKENFNSEMNGIRVTITRPDEKENYQPCDLFLNDIARLVPWLIDKDCFEVDILDRTCDSQDEFRNHRLYYVISESTWQLFQRSNERVILTNDQTLGQPLTNVNKDGKPSYLVFDQFSLAKCLADYCKEIGGCFEYTCVEEEKNKDSSRDDISEEVKNMSETVVKTEKVNGILEEVNQVVEMKEEGSRNCELIGKEQQRMKAGEEEGQKKAEKLDTIPSVKEQNLKENKMNDKTPRNKLYLEKESIKKEEKKAKFALGISEEAPKRTELKKRKTDFEESDKKLEKSEVSISRKGKEQKTSVKRKKVSPMQPEPNNCHVTTRSKSTSESNTSQKSDSPVSKKGTKKQQTPIFLKERLKKSIKPAQAEELRRKTRSGRLLEEVKQRHTATARIRKRKTNGESKKRREEMGEKEEGVKERRLRSQKAAPEPQGRGEKANVRAKSLRRTRKS